MSFSLSQSSMSKLVDAEFLYTLLGEEGFDSAKLNHIVTLEMLKQYKSDLVSSELKQSYYDLTVAFLQTVIPNFNEDHPVAANLGTIQKKDDDFSFWSSGIYFQDDVLFLQIGGSDTEKEIEPFRIPLTFNETLSIYSISGLPPHIQQGWKDNTFELANNEIKHAIFYSLTNPKSKICKHFEIWTRLKKNNDDPTNEVVANSFLEAICDEDADLSEYVDKIPTGGSTVAQSNHFLSPYYEAGKLNKFAFRVVGLELVERKKKDGETFRQLAATVDLSLCPPVPALAVNMSPDATQKSKVVELNTITKIQFNTGRSANPSTLYEKFLQAEKNKEMIDSGLSEQTSDMVLPPSVENFWIIEFPAPPNKSTNTPKYNVWTKFKPSKVLAVLKAVESPAVYGSVDIPRELLEAAQETVEVKADKVPVKATKTASKPSSEGTDNLDDSDDDF